MELEARRSAPRSPTWARIRELAEAIVADGGDAGQIVEKARELVGVLRGLEE